MRFRNQTTPWRQWVLTAVILLLPTPASALPAHPPDDDGAHNNRPAQRIITRGEPHATAEPDDRRFITNRESPVVLPLPGDEESFFFVVFGDRTGGPADGVKVLAEAVRETNLLEPDLVMTVGDLVEGYNQPEQWMVQMREYKEIMDRLLCPWFPVAGNHDIYWRPAETAPPEEHEKNYELHFGPLWYAFEHKKCWFIVLYSDEPNPLTGERNFNKPESQRMSDEQFTWLKETLERAKDADHVFLFLHHPRWLGGNYGDDWNKVHAVLVDAGNVTAVFAGHIHRMRYDGPHDGIEYVTLATVGGGQSARVPVAGYLHQFHIVTVRRNQIALASLPVGQVLDVRAITGEVSNETGRLAQYRPQFDSRLHIPQDGSIETIVKVLLTNPVSRPIDITLTPRSDDSRWSFSPDHTHRVIQPGEAREFTFGVRRVSNSVDEAFRTAHMSLNMDYLAEGARYSIPESVSDIPVRIDLSPPVVPQRESVLAVNGRNQCLRIADDLLDVPDGPLTLECWFRAESFGGRVGLVTKTENADYGFFVSRGVPSFSIFLDDRYAEARANRALLEVGQWHHLAGVYDGAEVRLYLDGELIARVRRNGPRRTNSFPLYIGADPDSSGNPMSFFHGMIDSVRLSTAVRYEGDSFTPARRFEEDDDTVLLLNMDGGFAQWVYDASGRNAHPIAVNGARLMEIE